MLLPERIGRTASCSPRNAPAASKDRAGTSDALRTGALRNARTGQETQKNGIKRLILAQHGVTY
jgi:hypothetical protein